MRELSARQTDNGNAKKSFYIYLYSSEEKWEEEEEEQNLNRVQKFRSSKSLISRETNTEINGIKTLFPTKVAIFALFFFFLFGFTESNKS